MVLRMEFSRTEVLEMLEAKARALGYTIMDGSTVVLDERALTITLMVEPLVDPSGPEPLSEPARQLLEDVYGSVPPVRDQADDGPTQPIRSRPDREAAEGVGYSARDAFKRASMFTPDQAAEFINGPATMAAEEAGPMSPKTLRELNAEDLDAWRKAMGYAPSAEEPLPAPQGLASPLLDEIAVRPGTPEDVEEEVEF